MARVLVVDEDPQVRRFLGVSLETCGHRVAEAENASDGLRLCQGRKYDLIILDPGVSDMTGLEVISSIRRRSAAPIIVLSNRADEATKVEALDRGADDYVVKPFGIGELMARMRAALRTSRPLLKPALVVVGDLRIDLSERRITRNGRDVHLTKREFDLLKVLASTPDHVISHHALLKAVWKTVRGDGVTYLRVYIMQLREKLERIPSRPTLIVTEPGVGYRLKTSGDQLSKGDGS
ncbi:response regulator [Magnetospirillum fulvum]|uniref:Two-component system, OmpR family, KDP operon response regulator KdpE n=1 Tax=Magnetospirillum fulvum TaxID=1082 RepID=A0A1H6I3H9_MAGFU|nr:response regulator transcription factor [Magnetospirillum fulvum]SEH41142.1 two-component system, OmpR family, KDP operon response regulator KdpE [Magnetospirillum fulvum]